MRLTKFLSLVAFITLISLLYVYQQTEIFRFAYLGQKKMVAFQDSLDQNTLLRYNIKKNTSLVQIDNNVFGVAHFEMPDSYRLVRLTYPQEVFRVVEQVYTEKRESIAFRLFGIKREAQAKTINPSNILPSTGLRYSD